MFFDIVGDREVYKDIEYGKLSVFAEAFLHVARKKSRVCVATVFVRRTLRRETSERQSMVVEVVLRGTETRLCVNKLVYHHITQTYHAVEM